MDQGAIDGKLFFVSGDASLGYMKCAFAMYFNQRLVEDFGIENPYDIVDAGKWTLDKVAEIASAASQDIDGNSKYNIEDKLGFVVHDWNHPKGSSGVDRIGHVFKRLVRRVEVHVRL